MSPKPGNPIGLRGLGAAGITALGVLGAAGVATAHHGPPPPPGAGPPAARPAPPAPHDRPVAPAKPRAHPLVTLNSEVERLLRGRRGEVHGLLLGDGTRVQAPPHAVVRTLGDLAGRAVSARGRLKPAHLAHATVVVDGETVTPPRHEAPEPRHGERRVERHGTITGVTRGPRGEANGIVLADGTTAAVPHNEVEAESLVGRTGRVSGHLKPAELHEATVTSGGTTYVHDAGPRARHLRKGHRPKPPRGDGPPRPRPRT